MLFVVAAGMAWGCRENTPEGNPRAAGYAYYPLAIGEFRIYDVTEIRFRHNIGDTTRFQLRERVDTSFLDQTNTRSYKIIRSLRQDQHSAWEDDSVLVVTKSATNVTLQQDNTKRVKLIFPVRNGKTWKGDAFNTTGGEKEDYQYQKVGMPFTIGNETYPASLTVQQGKRLKNLVLLDDRREVYVPDIGMVYRLFNKVVYCNRAESCEFGVDYKLYGQERHEVFVSHGKN